MATREPGRRAASGESDWLTLGQAAKFLGVAQSTIRKWSDVGRVPAFYTPGGHRRYRRSDLDSFLEHSGPGGAPAGGPVVLIVDDDDRMREYVKANLELEGYSVREAGSADRHLERWIVHHRAAWLNPMFEGLSYVGSFGLVWLVIAVICAFLWRRPYVVAWVALGILGDLAAHFLREAIGRPRPWRRYA